MVRQRGRVKLLSLSRGAILGAVFVFVRQLAIKNYIDPCIPSLISLELPAFE